MAERLALARPPRLGRRARLVLAGAVAALVAATFLDLSAGGLGRASGWRLAGELAAAAFAPDFVGTGTVPLWRETLEAARQTLVFAAAGVSLGLALGVPLALLGTSAGWTREARPLARGARAGLFAAARALAALLRSVHELVWAVLFLAAFGLSPLSGAFAIALPYAGTFAKVFAELLEEAPRDAADALRAAGARPLEVFLVGLAPRALPDALAYTFYRFECGVRSSAVLGFFGLPTLGYHIERAVANLALRELWAFLYALLALVLVLELWSDALRRRLVRR